MNILQERASALFGNKRGVGKDNRDLNKGSRGVYGGEAPEFTVQELGGVIGREASRIRCPRGRWSECTRSKESVKISMDPLLASSLEWQQQLVGGAAAVMARGRRPRRWFERLERGRGGRGDREYRCMGPA